MKKVILKELHMINFRGAKDVKTTFNNDVTTISGRNGIGKSRHFDAFIWLLFGKDSQDRKDFDIKTRDELGNTTSMQAVDVIGVLDVDGVELKLQRSLIEDWVKPRGQVDQVYKGNHTEYIIDDVPTSMSSFKTKVSEIVDESVFKMITNPAYFATMKWKDQRDQLMELAGSISNEELAAKDKDFIEFLAKLEGRTVNDYRAKLAAQRKKISKRLDAISPKIEQTNKMMPESLDWLTLESQLKEIDEKITLTNASISDSDEGNKAIRDEKRKINDSIDAYNRKKRNLVSSLQSEFNEKSRKFNETRDDINRTCVNLSNSINDNISRLDTIKNDLAKADDDVSKLNKRREILIAEWKSITNRIYEPSTICSHCGQKLPVEMLDDMEKKFNDKKSDDLDTNRHEGMGIATSIKKKADYKLDLQERVDSLACEINTLKEQLSQAQSKQANNIVSKPEVATEAAIPECQVIDSQIAELKEKLNSFDTPADNKETKMYLQNLNAQRDSIVESLNVRNDIKRYQNEINSLQSEAKTLSQELANIERDEYTAEQFNKAKIEEMEARTNSKFKLVSFKLFNYTINGGEVETCIPMVNGVAYGTLNAALQINAGLDIINTLARFYGICAPIFIDQRESVNELIDYIPSQIINLTVTEENSLTVK